jgi:hypothetical protein
MKAATETRPNFETATYLGYLAFQHAVDYLKSKGFTLDDLGGANAVRSKVLDSISRIDPIWFFGVGHGNADRFTGQNYDNIWWTCDCSQLSGRVVYLLSCITGASLGPDMVNNKKAKTNISYKETFTWIQASSQDPLVDKYAKGFYEPVMELIYSLADGLTAREAWNANMDKWNYWIDYWRKSSDPYAATVLQWLIHDRDCQVMFGDESARVVEAEVIPPIWMALGMLPVMLVSGVIVSNEATKIIAPIS